MQALNKLPVYVRRCNMPTWFLLSSLRLVQVDVIQISSIFGEMVVWRKQQLCPISASCPSQTGTVENSDGRCRKKLRQRAQTLDRTYSLMFNIVLWADELWWIRLLLLSCLSILAPTMHSVSPLCIPGWLQGLSFQRCSALWQAVNVSRLEVCFWCLYLSVTLGAGLRVCQCVFNQERGLRKVILWQLHCPHLLHAITEQDCNFLKRPCDLNISCNCTPNKLFLCFTDQPCIDQILSFFSKMSEFLQCFQLLWETTRYQPEHVTRL